MELLRLETWQFRNLEDGTIEFASGLNRITGSNGQGKTNCLEAISVGGNVRSFRQTSPRKMVRHGERAFRIDLWVQHGERTVHLRQIVECQTAIKRTLEINGMEATLRDYLSQFPVFTLSSADSALVAGPPEHRRSFLDRLAFLVDPGHLDDLGRYHQALRQRNAALVRDWPDDETELWEDQLADAAARVVTRRQAVIDRWRPNFLEVYDEMKGRGFPGVDAAYRTEADLDVFAGEKVAEFYRRRYHESRVRDRQAGFTLEGPHRHDLALKTGKFPVRDVLSAGQVRVLAAALWISNLAQVENGRNERLPVLLDDADAELDDQVFFKLVASLGQQRQVVMTSASENRFVDVLPQATEWSMNEGKLRIRTNP